MTQEQQGQAEMKMHNIKEIGKYSYELEEKREQSLLDQAGKMMTAFSLFIAAINVLLSAVLEHATIPISKNKLIFLAGIIFFFLLVSLFFAIMAQWRYKYKIIQNGQVWLDDVKANPQDYRSQGNFDMEWVNQLKKLQDKKEEINNKRVKFIKASITIFLFAVCLAFLLCLYLNNLFFCLERKRNYVFCKKEQPENRF